MRDGLGLVSKAKLTGFDSLILRQTNEVVMAFPIPVVSGLFELGKSWLEGRKRKQEARDEREAELIRQAGSWDEIHAQGSATSWKDEWILVLWTIPMVMCFIPGLGTYAERGFSTLAEVAPDWYLAAWGIRS